MSVPFEAYQGKEPYIFVSYAHKDKDVIYNEIKRLDEEGYNIWHDEGIQPATEWTEEIALAINNCSTFLVFISPQSIKSKNVRTQFKFKFIFSLQISPMLPLEVLKECTQR